MLGALRAKEYFYIEIGHLALQSSKFLQITIDNGYLIIYNNKKLQGEIYMSVNVFARYEIILHSDKSYANPFMDVDIDAVFTHSDGTTIALPGFWNGGNEWKVRFSPEKAGVWYYTVACTDKENASLTQTGEIEAIAVEPKTELEKHGYVKLTEGKRYLTYGDGTPFFYLGDTHWQMPDCERLHECNYPGCTCGNQFKHLADDRIKKGFTVYQTYFDSAESDGGGNPRVHHWWKEKFSLINPEAFNETMDVMIEYLAEKGITTAMGFGVHCSSVIGFNYQAEPLLKFTRYCIARYACYPVVWITAQEITNLTSNGTVSAYDIWKQVGALVSELDGYHRPNGAHIHAHPATDPRSVDLEQQPWHQWWTLQAGHGDVEQLVKRWFYKGYHDMPKHKLYIETECFYEDLGSSGYTCGSDTTRRGAWNAVLAGSAGFTYGVVGVWAMRWDNNVQGWNGYSPEPWYVGMDKPGSTEMKYMKEFLEYVGWSELEPSFGYEHGVFETRKTVSIATRKQEVFVYYFFDDESETGMAMGLKPNTEYQARWYDPIHGSFIDLPSFVSTENGYYNMPERPSRRDWVLLLNCVDLGAYTAIKEYPKYERTLAPSDVKHGEEIKVQKAWASVSANEHPAENMIDGREDTFWCTNATMQSRTVWADLGEPQELGWLQLVAKMEQPLFIRYRVYGSNDGENYELISERPIKRAIGIGGPYTDFYDTLHGKYRFVKIFFHSSYADAPMLELTKLGFYKK